MQSKWQRVGQRVSSAKRWLARAEEEFSKERPMRGELNLMLAEAELKRLKESEPSRGRSLLRYGTVLGIAVIVCAFSAIGFMRPNEALAPTKTPLPSHEVFSSMQQLRLDKIAAPDSAPVASSRATSFKVVPAVEKPSEPQPEEIETPRDNSYRASRERPAASVGMSDAEVRQLVRKAGQTLRGQ